MMYQRDIAKTCLNIRRKHSPTPAPPHKRERENEALAEQAQQIFDQRREEGVDAEEEESEQERHDDHHDAGGDSLLARRPVDLRRFGADLTDEFAGGRL